MTGHHDTDGKPAMSEADAPNTETETKPTSEAAENEAPAAEDAGQPRAEADNDTASRGPQVEIAALEAQVKDLTDRLLRAHAEMENLRKRTERDKADTAKYAITKFALDMVGISDNLQRALDAAGKPEEQAAEVKAMFEGVALTGQELGKALERHGVMKIEALGKIFDPHLHQAMMEQPNPEVPSGTILQVFQDGFIIGERVLRPSMVVVARGGMKPKPAGDGEKPQAELAPEAQPAEPDADQQNTDDGGADQDAGSST